MIGYVVEKEGLADRLGRGKDVPIARRFITRVAIFGFVWIARSGACAPEVPVLLKAFGPHDHEIANHYS